MRVFMVAVVCAAALSVTLPAQQGASAVRRAARPVPSQYIVVLRAPEDPVALAAETSNRFGGRVRHLYRAALRGFSVRLPAAAAEALARDPRVRFVEEDAEIEVSQVQVSPPWGLDRIDQRTIPVDGRFSYGFFAGTPVTAHVIDTGVRPTHTEFAGRAFIAGDYVDDDGDSDPSDVANDDADPAQPDGADCHGHGTHVAATIAGVTSGVAKYVTIQSHRVFGCTGSGLTSAVIAAVDAVTSDPMRPAVANMSLGGSASAALDDAVRTSIAAGVTYVIAAGNNKVDASKTSPARVAEAITVGATTPTDARAGFSNFGPVLDLFAPGDGVRSAWYTSDVAMAKLSGTSMAAPHVAGAAAVFLERFPASSPAEVRDALVAASTPDLVTNAGAGSPNRLLYTGFLHASAPTVTVSSPNGGEKLFTATPFVIEWAVEDPDGISSQDVYASVDNGTTYTAIADCTGLAGHVRACTWTTPGPASTKARIKVVATDPGGQSGAGFSAATFQIVTGSATVTVTSPKTKVNWGRQSTQQIKWSHNLGANSFMRIELSRDGGNTFPETIAIVKNTSGSAGTYDWAVTGPNTINAVVRVSWTNGPAADASNIPFTIADPFLTMAAPSSSSVNWGYDTLQRVKWTTNLGAGDTVTVLLAADGGNFTTTLGSGLLASKGTADVRIPSLGAPTSAARLRVVWANAPAAVSLAATNPSGFKVQPAFITVTAPVAGSTWTVGSSGKVKWTSNLGSLERVLLSLSQDDGQTFPIQLVASTPSDGSQGVTVQAAWATNSGRIRLTWLRTGSVAGISPGAFTIK
jgi:subtilisin family serine protease